MHTPHSASVVATTADRAGRWPVGGPGAARDHPPGRPGVPRAHLAAAAQRLRGEGLSYPAIARELHVALSTAHRLVTGG